jgi:hypothetical protein
MRAEVAWRPGPPPQLRLTFQNARLADDAGDARPDHDIDGVQAITRAVDTDNGVRIDNITQQELRAGGFVEPELADGPATGALLSLVIVAEGPAALPYRIGQMFSIDASRARASMRYLITPVVHRLWHTAHLWPLLPAASKATGLAATNRRHAPFSLPTPPVPPTWAKFSVWASS